MEESRSKIGAARRDERGFTLPEVMITIVILGIILAIASSSWFGVVRSRAVDSATNQVVADMRLAHSSATNQLTDWAVVEDPASLGLTLPVGVPTGRDYYLVRVPSSGVPLTTSDIKGRDLPDEGADVEIDPTTPLAARFNPDGSAEVLSGGASTIQIHLQGEVHNSQPNHDINLVTATSRVSVD